MRHDLAAVGGALVLAGIAVTLRPGLAPELPPVWPRQLAAVAVFATVAGLVAIGRSASSGSEVDPPSEPDESDGASDLPTIGASFDTALAQVETLSATRLRRSEGPAYLRERLRAAAVATVAREEGIDHDRAAEVVDRGGWTDDPAAAAFLGEDVAAPLGLRVRETLSTTPRAVQRARRTVAALEGRP